MVKSEKMIKVEQNQSQSPLPLPTPTPNQTNSNNDITINNSTKKKYKGVRMRSWGSWVSEIRAPSQKTRIWLGSYSTADAAARAYDAALICLKGSKASLNFPTSSSLYQNDIPRDVVLSPKSIQRVAAAAAAGNYGHAPASTGNDDPGTDHSSSSSSSSMVSSPSDYWCHVEQQPMEQDFDVAALDQYSPRLYGVDHHHPMMMMTTSSSFFDPDTMFLDDETDIPLWSFC